MYLFYHLVFKIDNESSYSLINTYDTQFNISDIEIYKVYKFDLNNYFN